MMIMPRLGLRGALYAICEGWAIASEAIIYAVLLPETRVARALGAAAIANGASFAVGLALMATDRLR